MEEAVEKMPTRPWRHTASQLLMLTLHLSSSTTRYYGSFILTHRSFSASPFLVNEPLQGTAPPHRFLVFLHNPNRPSVYPAKFSTSVQRALGIHLVKHGGLVIHAWSPDQSLSPGTRMANSNSASEETYSATAFTPKGRVDIPEISATNAEEWANKLLSGSALLHTSTSEDTVYLYVCTHGARDCRCGNTGGKVVKALREEVEKRGLERQVKIAETAHLGGHKYVILELYFSFWMLIPLFCVDSLLTSLSTPVANGRFPHARLTSWNTDFYTLGWVIWCPSRYRRSLTPSSQCPLRLTGFLRCHCVWTTGVAVWVSTKRSNWRCMQPMWRSDRRLLLWGA